MMRYQKAVYPLFSFALIVLIFNSLISHTSWAEISDLILNKHWRGTALFLLFSFSQSILRTWQYSILLRALEAPHRALPLFLIVLVRNFCSDLLPARIGTTVYIFLVQNRLNVSPAVATASFSIAFAIDLIAIAPLVIIFSLAAGGVFEEFQWVAISVSVALLALVFGGLRVLPTILEYLSRQSLPGYGRFPAVAEKIQKLCATTAEQVRIAQQTGVYGQVLFLGIFIRVFKYAALYFFLFALLFPLGYTIEKLPFTDVFIGLCAAEFAAGLPISPPGGFGLYEGVWAAVFTLLGFEKSLAIETGVAHHLFTQVYGYVLAGVSLLTLLILGKNQIPQPNAKPSLGFRSYQTISLAVCGIILLALLTYRYFPIEQPTTLTPPKLQQSAPQEP